MFDKECTLNSGGLEPEMFYRKGQRYTIKAFSTYPGI